jgi:hypothetical protein
VIGSQQRNTSLADPIKHQQGRAKVTAHQDVAVQRFDLDLAEPAAPAGRGFALGSGKALVESFGDRVALAVIGDLRAERFFDDIGGRRSGDNDAKGRTIQAFDRGELRPGSDQNRAALFDIIANRVKILRG